MTAETIKHVAGIILDSKAMLATGMLTVAQQIEVRVCMLKYCEVVRRAGMWNTVVREMTMQTLGERNN